MREENILFKICYDLSEYKKNIDLRRSLPFKTGYYVTEYGAIIYVDVGLEVYHLRNTGWEIAPYFYDLWYDSMDRYVDVPVELIEKYEIPKFEDK